MFDFFHPVDRYHDRSALPKEKLAHEQPIRDDKRCVLSG
jgi:hypothetical protein